jgi:hypothetical protein
MTEIDDIDPQERAQAEALARALDGFPASDAPADTLETAAFLRSAARAPSIEAHVRGLEQRILRAPEPAQIHVWRARLRAASIASAVLAAAAAILLVVLPNHSHVVVREVSTPTAAAPAEPSMASGAEESAARPSPVPTEGPSPSDPFDFAEEVRVAMENPVRSHEALGIACARYRARRFARIRMRADTSVAVYVTETLASLDHAGRETPREARITLLTAYARETPRTLTEADAWFIRSDLARELALLAYAQGDMATAVRELERVLAEGEGERVYAAALYVLVADAYAREGRTRDAEDALSRARARLQPSFETGDTPLPSPEP